MRDAQRQNVESFRRELLRILEGCGSYGLEQLVATYPLKEPGGLIVLRVSFCGFSVVSYL